MNTKHLKAKILDLAIRGKLVPQDSSEGNAAELLQKIREEKGGESLPLAAAGKPSSATPSAGSNAARNARSKNASFIIKADDGKHYEQFPDGSLKDVEDEIPFEIPENWCWCRLKDVCKEISDLDHRMPKPFPNGIPYISPLDFTKDGKINLKSAKKVSLKDYEDLSKKSRPEKGDIIFPRYGTIGKIRCIDFEEPCLVSYSCATIKVNLHSMNNEYIKYVLNSPLIQIDEIQKYINETTQANVGLQSIKDFKFPLPPLSEQQRIVSAIEKAFEQIDIIEKNKLNLKTYIKQTKSKVLDLAIHGKLVEQNPQEGNAFELLEKIRNEKAELIKQKKLKEDKNASFIVKTDDGKHYEQFADGSLKDIEDEIPFEEPAGWTWCRINEIVVDMADGPFGSNLKSEHYTTNREARIIQLSNLSDEGWREENTRYTTIKHATEKISRSIVKAGNIVIAKMMPAGRAMICPDKEQMYVLSSDCVKLVPIEGVDKQFLVRTLNSPFFRNRVVDNVQGVTRQRTSISKLRNCYFPLPPLSEQKRIVAKIEQVFEQLDVLEKSLGE